MCIILDIIYNGQLHTPGCSPCSMKKSDPTDFTICRLLTLLLIVLVGLGRASNQVNGASLGVIPMKDAKIDFGTFFSNTTTVEETGTNIRKHLLYNLCSDRVVKIFRRGRKGINARGKVDGKNMEFSKLIFASTPAGTIKIYGQKTDLHICFNKRGKLVAKSSDKSILCHFKEEYSEGHMYTHYRSASTKLLYLGFNKNGRPLKGTDFNRKKEDCFKFHKMDHNPSRTSSTFCSGKPEGVNFCDKKFLDIINPVRNKKRHNRQHRKRGKG